ncbi:MAG: hypothetical protein ACKOXB_06765 [Flavobacteriales bacterium]
MEKIIDLVDGHFGRGYSSAYFEDGRLKEGYKLMSSDNAFILYSEHNSAFQLPYKKVLFLNVVVVDKANQGKGEGSKLLSNFYERFSAEYTIVVPLWKYKGSEGLRHWILKKNGTLFHSFNEYWRDDSLEKGYHCLECGPPPCRCSMDLYVLDQQ